MNLFSNKDNQYSLANYFELQITLKSRFHYQDRPWIILQVLFPLNFCAGLRRIHVGKFFLFTIDNGDVAVAG
jgi:uncharacterized protein YllA (UPF0747 family)